MTTWHILIIICMFRICLLQFYYRKACNPCVDLMERFPCQNEPCCVRTTAFMNYAGRCMNPLFLNVTSGKYAVWLTLGFMVSDMHKPICGCNSFIAELCFMRRDPKKEVMVLLKFASAIAYQVIISGEGGGAVNVLSVCHIWYSFIVTSQILGLTELAAWYPCNLFSGHPLVLDNWYCSCCPDVTMVCFCERLQKFLGRSNSGSSVSGTWDVIVVDYCPLLCTCA